MIGWVSRRGQLTEDTAIGTLFSASMALGVVLLGLVPSYTADLMSFLFGNILAVTRTDLALLAAVSLAVLGFIAFFFKELLTAAFDEELAMADGLPVNLLYFGLLTAVALTVVVTVKVVGVVLSSALLVIPAAIGFELAKDYRKMLAISLAAGVSGSLVGLVLSFHFDVASGGAIVLSETLLFFLAYLASPRRARRWRPPRSGLPAHRSLPAEGAQGGEVHRAQGVEAADRRLERSVVKVAVEHGRDVDHLDVFAARLILV